MTNGNDTQLIEQAKAVLQGNQVEEGFTKPAPNLYPHQWSWDAAFIAMGYAHFDQAQAERELRYLFDAQWGNGLVPHVVYNPKGTGYFPGPEFWEIENSPHAPPDRRTSGLVQPPVHATAALHIYRHAQDTDRARAFITDLFPKLCEWHAYLYRERDPHDEGLVYIRHNWESGQDNSPIWDPVWHAYTPRADQIPTYHRLDTTHVDAADRPTNADYDRYTSLIKLFAACNYDEARIQEQCPFLVQDVLFNTLLSQANRDLAELARILGHDPDPFEAWAERTAQAIDAKLWNDDLSMYVDFDLVTAKPLPVPVAAGFCPLFAGIPDQARAERMYNYLNSPSFCQLDDDCYPVPSYDRRSPDYTPNRYWRGPVWIHIDWLLMHGLRRYGFDAYANRIRQTIVDLPSKHGFYEYFDPERGTGHGSGTFSWTAALLIDVLMARTT